MTDQEDLQLLCERYPERRLELCPSRFCRLSVRKRLAVMAMAGLGPAVIAALFALAEPALRGYGLPDRALEVGALVVLGSLWLAWIVLRGGGRIAMDVIALLESGLTGGGRRTDFEPVFDRANARAQLNAFLDDLERSHYTGTVPIQFKGGQPRRVTATEELDLSLPLPLGGREPEKGQR
ncbi:MAG: hypothetical protein ACYC1C_02455 [Chloroflexota bacterium]